MALVAFDPFGSLLSLQRDLDRIFGKPALDLGLSGGNVFPLINVFSDRDGFVVRAEVPGIKADDLSVDVERGRLTVSGERKLAPAKDGAYHRRERRAGKFSRALRLPDDIDAQAATAELRDGVLTVRIPKLAETRPRQITVKAA